MVARARQSHSAGGISIRYPMAFLSIVFLFKSYRNSNILLHFHDEQSTKSLDVTLVWFYSSIFRKVIVDPRHVIQIFVSVFFKTSIHSQLMIVSNET